MKVSIEPELVMLSIEPWFVSMVLVPALLNPSITDAPSLNEKVLFCEAESAILIVSFSSSLD